MRFLTNSELARKLSKIVLASLKPNALLGRKMKLDDR